MSTRDYAMRVLETQEDDEFDSEDINSSRDHRVANLRTMLGRLIDAEQEIEITRGQLELERVQLRAIFDCIDQPITVLDLYTKQILFYNEAFETLVGKVEEDATCHSSMYGETGACELCPFASEPVDKVNAYSFENYSERLDRWFYCIHKFVLWPNGDMHEAIFSLAIDVTGRKKIEEDLRKSEIKFSKAFFNSPIAGGITTASEGKFIDVNDAFEALTKYKRRDVIGKTVFDLDLYADEQDRVNILKLLKTDGCVSGYDLWIRRRDGRLCYGSMHVDVLDDQDDMQILSVVVDATDKRDLEDAYKSVTEFSLQGLIIFAEDRILFANNKSYAILGSAKDQTENEPLSSWISHIYEPDKFNVVSRIQQTLKGCEVDEYYEFRYIKPDGTMIWLEVRSRLIDYHGRKAIQTAFQDVTKTKQMEEELCKLRKMMKETNGV